MTKAMKKKWLRHKAELKRRGELLEIIGRDPYVGPSAGRNSMRATVRLQQAANERRYRQLGIKPPKTQNARVRELKWTLNMVDLLVEAAQGLPLHSAPYLKAARKLINRERPL